MFKEQGGTNCTGFIEQYYVSEDERKQPQSQTWGQVNVWKVQTRGLVTSIKLKVVYTKEQAIKKARKPLVSVLL